MKIPTQDAWICEGYDFPLVCFVCLFALFPEEAAICQRTHMLSCLQILSLGLTMCHSLFSCGHLILHQNHCWPFLVFMMSIWIFIIIWAPDTKQTANIVCFYLCKVWTCESQYSCQVCHFSFLYVWLMDVTFPEKNYLYRWTPVVAYILWVT